MCVLSEEYEVLKGYYYTKEDTWAKIVDGSVRVGITDYAQKQMREITFVELPRVGDLVEQFKVFGSIESTKAVYDLHSPISGTIKKVNKELESRPDSMNWSPYEVGWIIEVQPTKLEEELKNLMNAERYKEFIKER